MVRNRCCVSSWGNEPSLYTIWDSLQDISVGLSLLVRTVIHVSYQGLWSFARIVPLSGLISSILIQRYQRTSRQRYSPCEGPKSLLGDEGLCSGGTKLNSVLSPLRSLLPSPSSPLTGEGVRRVLPEFRVTGPHPWPVASFPPHKGHPSPTFVSQIGNTSRTINIKPNKRLGLEKKPYPLSLPEQVFASTTQQMEHVQKRSSRNQNLNANHRDKHKSINGKKSEQAKQVRLGTIIGMVRGNTNKKRPSEQSEQWLDNEISFPSTPGCQLVDSPIILEALIEGFLVRRIYVDGGSSSEVMYEHCFRNLRVETRAKLKES
ncbi:hypothetical protein Tco_0957546 [Tanacetum coccineum]